MTVRIPEYSVERVGMVPCNIDQCQGGSDWLAMRGLADIDAILRSRGQRTKDHSYRATPKARLNPARPFGVMLTTRERGVRSTHSSRT